jgi:AcrR family transcriptional regulator
MKKDGSVDLRIRRTRKAIRESFFELVKKDGFEHISVKDITDGAMVSRNTFYLHYTDKYDLLDKICDDMVHTLYFRIGMQLRRVQQHQFSPESVATVISLGISAIDDDKEAYKVLFEGESSEVLTEKLSGVVMDCLNLFIDDIGGIDDFSAQYIVSGMIGIIKYYATNDVDDINEKCLNFTKLHLGKIIDYANEKKRCQV